MIRVPDSHATTTPAVRAVMQGNRRRDSAPERALRSALHRRGLRYFIDRRVGAGRGAPRPDVVFPRARVAVFVDGCFWHGCPRHGVSPRSNSDYWGPKILRNRERDTENNRLLEGLGWVVVRVWEHDDPDEVACRIHRLVAERRVASTAD